MLMGSQQFRVTLFVEHLYKCVCVCVLPIYFCRFTHPGVQTQAVSSKQSVFALVL